MMSSGMSEFFWLPPQTMKLVFITAIATAALVVGKLDKISRPQKPCCAISVHFKGVEKIGETATKTLSFSALPSFIKCHWFFS